MKKTIPIVAAAALMASVQVNAADMQKQQQPMNGAGGNTTEAPAGTAPAPTGAAPAQSGDGSFGGSGAAQEAPADQVLKPTTAEELKGEDVYNAEGDKVASVKEIVKEAGGKSDHAVLTVGGIFGIVNGADGRQRCLSRVVEPHRQARVSGARRNAIVQAERGAVGTFGRAGDGGARGARWR